MNLARLLLRVILGASFVGHGAQKLLGWFGGRGLEATAQGFDGMGIRPGRLQATAASATETMSGALLLLGFATPLAASGITAVMLTAIKRVHGKNGFWNGDSGYEFNLLLMAAALALAEVGPGTPSLESALGIDVSGSGWAVAALAAGSLGAVGADALAASQPEPTIETPPQPARPRQPVTEQPAMVS
jgi:putative oxidoreductase